MLNSVVSGESLEAVELESCFPYSRAGPPHKQYFIIGKREGPEIALDSETGRGKGNEKHGSDQSREVN